MSYYSRGNLAYEVNRQPKTSKKVKRTVVVRPGVPTSEKLLYLFLIGVLVAAAGFVGVRYSAISQNNYEIQKLKGEIANNKSLIESMRLKVDELRNPNRIEAEAAKQGMVRNMESVRIMTSKSVGNTGETNTKQARN
ncbi:cell division protein FtsL [Brevibacillus daliensis]|uniref:cell division protein FtsL n=1 Tax=Brevibacillus daliensis TaxID=2892995 RepID=UPI001E416C50|nr:cell division protein FtsL [Brevibacillus daliensis]